MEGLPLHRDKEILRSVINSPDTFFRYLRLLLSDVSDPFGAAMAVQKSSGGTALGGAIDDSPILEDMVRALCNGRDKFDAIKRLMSRMEVEDGHCEDRIPAEFSELWKAFQNALGDEERP